MFQKGHKKFGGRKKGTKNKSDIFAICEKHGINVFEEMVILAAKEMDPEKRFFKFSQLAPYLYAKKREVTSIEDFSLEEIMEAAETKMNDEPAAS